ncbi:MAG: ferrochelatase [Deltaproteobacteria bacterium]|nr:ferrochelatase [Deltaproteobacteria bacterium]
MRDAVTSPARPFDAVLLIAFGGPTAPHEIRPFLQNVTRGRPIPPARLEEVAHHYDKMGGRSPLNELTFRQADALRARLAQAGLPLPVYVGMRNWHPYLAETLRGMRDARVARAFGIILSAHDSEAGWQRYLQDVLTAQAGIRDAGESCPDVEFAPNWHDADGYVTASAARIAAALEPIPGGERAATPLVFTAHSIPADMASASRYVEQFTRSARLVAERLGHARWQLAYQSRSGRPQDPWLEPDINLVIEQLAAAGERRLVVAPIGFVCDHVEVLYDLDDEAQATAARCGIAMTRAGTVNDHPGFIAMLAGLVENAWGRPR